MLVSNDQRLVESQESPDDNGQRVAEIEASDSEHERGAPEIGKARDNRLALKKLAARRRYMPSEASLLCEKALFRAYMTRRAYMLLYTRIWEAANYNAIQMQRKLRLAQTIDLWISRTFELHMLSKWPHAWQAVYALLSEPQRRALMCTCVSFATSYRESRLMQQKAKRLYLPMLKYLDKVC